MRSTRSASIRVALAAANASIWAAARAIAGALAQAHGRPGGAGSVLLGEPPRPLLTRAPLPGETLEGGRSAMPLPALTDTIDFGFYEVRPKGRMYTVNGGIWT